MKHQSRKETRTMYSFFQDLGSGTKIYPKFRYLLHCRVTTELYVKKLAKELT